MRLCIDPQLRMAPSEAKSLSLLDVIRFHAYLDRLDEEREAQAAKMERR